MNKSLSAAVFAFSAVLMLSLAATPSYSQGPGYGPGTGPGPGAGKGPGYGPGPGKGPGGDPAAKGPGKGPGFSFGSGNTRGWGMMNPSERNEHRDRMLSMKTLAECKAALAEHSKLMEARAKERGAAVPRGPRSDMCDLMKQRGRIS